MTAPKYTPPADGWRTFLIVWATQSFSVFGSALTIFAINIWLITTVYPDPAQKADLAWTLSLINIAFAIPTVFFAPIAGAWVDRYDRKRTLILADVCSAFVSGTMLYLIASHQFNVPSVIILVFGSAFITTFHTAAFDTSYAMLVPEERLPRANGMMQTIFALSGLISPGVAATLIALPALVRQTELLPAFISWIGAIADGAVIALSVDVLTFAVAAVVPLFLFIPSPQRTDLQNAQGQKKSLWADVREGALYIWHRRSFLWLLGTFSIANFAAGAFVLVPLIVKFQLNANREALGLSIEALLALLNTIGSVAGLNWRRAYYRSWGGLKKNRVYGVLVPMIFSGLALSTFGMSSYVFLSAGMMALTQSLLPLMNAHSQAIWQTQVPRELQGRVFSVRRLIAQFTWPASTLIMGGLAAYLDPSIILLSMGVLFALAALSGLFNPYLRRVEDREWIEAQALRHQGLAAE